MRLFLHTDRLGPLNHIIGRTPSLEAQNKSSRSATPQAPAKKKNAPCVRCRRCPSTDVVRLHKARKRDNDVYRCALCRLVFSPPNYRRNRSRNHLGQGGSQ